MRRWQAGRRVDRTETVRRVAGELAAEVKTWLPACATRAESECVVLAAFRELEGRLFTKDAEPIAPDEVRAIVRRALDRCLPEGCPARVPSRLYSR